VIKHQRHLGFAADTPNGLVVPVVHDVDRKGILELAGELTELSGGPRRQARAEGHERVGVHDLVARRDRRHELHAAGQPAAGGDPRRRALGDEAGVGRAQFVPRLMLPLSLSYDHRVIDGAAAARFVVHLVKLLGDLRRVLL
jgi:pyruvate dehydrogenase E2 component (dihydrolipoamide acetyltransferase)